MWDLIVWVPDHCLSFYFSRNLQLLVSLYEHGTFKFLNLLANHMNCMEILPIYCYNDDGFDLDTTKKQRTHIIFTIKVI